MGLRRSVACILAIAIASPALAGPFEDGVAAYGKLDYASAAKFYGQGAVAGDDRSQLLLGIMYVYGVGVPLDTKQGLDWLNLSAKNGNAAAEDALGDVYAGGSGVPLDWSQAAAHYSRAAKGGNAPAEKSIGDFYFYGRGGTKQDYAAAVTWYVAAAKQNNADAEYSLGYMYFFGGGVPIDYAQAVSYLTAAAQQDDAGAQMVLGLAYDEGHGVPQDFTAAVEQYSRAAAHGNIKSFGLLGEKFYNGQGVKRDFSRAYVFLNLAAASEKAADMQKSMAEERDSAAQKLSPAQLTAAQTLATRCRANIQDCEALPRVASAVESSGPKPSTTAVGEVEATGSGFYINSGGQIVTNAHVVQTCSAVRLAGGHSLKQVAIDSNSDIALLASNTKPMSFAKLRGGKGARLGEEVVAVGYPLAGLLSSEPIVSNGTISALSGLDNDRRNIQISAPVQPGNSGGPLLGYDGAVLGIVSGKLDAIKVAAAINDIPQNVNFAVSVGTLQSFLNANGVQYSQGPAASEKKTSAAIAAEASRYTVLLECLK